MPSLELDTLKEASLARPEGGIWIDLRSGFSSMSSSEAEEKINGILSDELEKEKDEDSSNPSKGKEEEDPEAGEDGKKGKTKARRILPKWVTPQLIDPPPVRELLQMTEGRKV